MKKLQTLSLTLILAFLMASCAGGGASGPKSSNNSSSDEKDYSNYTSLVQVLRSVPGVIVSGTLSNPNIILRGGGSGGINNVQPLFVIDNVVVGKSYEQANSLVAPDNIKSVRALSGLSATNRYGQEGAGGVILITTKASGNQ